MRFDRLKAIRMLPCVVCANIGAEPHHIIRQGHGITGGKADDSETIALCRVHHNELHHNVRAFEEEHGTQIEMLAKTNRWLDVCYGERVCAK